MWSCKPPELKTEQKMKIQILSIRDLQPTNRTKPTKSETLLEQKGKNPEKTYLVNPTIREMKPGGPANFPEKQTSSRFATSRLQLRGSGNL